MQVKWQGIDKDRDEVQDSDPENFTVVAILLGICLATSNSTLSLVGDVELEVAK